MITDQSKDLEKLEKVERVLSDVATGSWELGTEIQALLEYHVPHLTPFNDCYTSETLKALDPASVPARILVIANQVLANKPTKETFPAGLGKVLIIDGAVGDPGSLITGCLVASGVGRDERSEAFLEAARSQVEFFVEDAPRTEDGAVSHRFDQVQLWADFVYMCPPTVALFGLHTLNRSLIDFAYQQCSLHRKYYLNSDTGLWKHIVLGTGKTDYFCWATSNGWAAAGMLRVLVIILRSPWSGDMKQERDSLLTWVEQILDAVIVRVTPTGMVRDYIDEEKSFEESCGTALLASVAFRLAQWKLTSKYLPFAHTARARIDGLVRADGVLEGVCDIHDERQTRAVSAEGQAFVMLLEAAWRDWKKAVA